MKISPKYQHWLALIENPPKMIAEAIKIGKLDTDEIPGKKSNAEIMALAKVAGVEKIYAGDEVPWCAVAMTAIALRAGKKVPFESYDRMRAKSFLKFGHRIDVPELGDVLVFLRAGGYHVGLYVGEDDTCYHVAGGNQSNTFNIVRIPRLRLVEARRPHYSVGKPASVQRIFLEPFGTPSENEV